MRLRNYRWMQLYFLVISSSLFVPSLLYGASYTITNLGSLGNNASYATGLNDSGQVVGYYEGTGISSNVAWIWNAGSGMNNLTDELGSPPKSNAYGINNAGIVTGVIQVSTQYHAFSWDTVSGVDDLGQYGGYSINNDGDIAGRTGSSGSTAYLWRSDGTTANLGYLPGGPSSSYAYAINDYEEIAGYSYIYTPALHTRAFIWDSTGGMVNIGTLGGDDSSANGINNLGQVVGYSEYISGVNIEHAFLWQDGSGMIDLGTLGTRSNAYDINNSSVVVGESYVSGQYRAFIWENDTGMVDLNTLVEDGTDWILHRATAINELGQIVGYGTLSGESDYRAFILTPIGLQTAVPEPATLFLVGTASAYLAVRTKKRYR